MNFKEQIEDNERFVSYLKEKYPSLFVKDKEGNLITPDCGIYCPLGWRDIVDHLCGCIVHEVEYGCEYIPNKNIFVRLQTLAWTALFSSITSSIMIDLDLYHDRMLTYDMREELEKKHKVRYWIRNQIINLRNFIRPKNTHVPTVSSPVKIEQIKEKFGTLRFYYSGGNKSVKGMVALAEYISAKTCQHTGTTGSMYINSRGWIKTLSPSEAKKENFTKYESH